MDTRIVITGVGLVSSLGTGRECFFEALFAGADGTGPVQLFDTASLPVKLAAPVKDFSAEQILGAQGLRTLDRSTRLLLAAGKLALQDAGLAEGAVVPEALGVATGSTLGSLKSICGFDIESLREGPRYVNPALFPNTVLNSSSSQLSIRCNARAFNVTMSQGACSGLAALRYAAQALLAGRARVVLAGGVEELCEEAFMGMLSAGILSGSRPGSETLSCPFDRRRNGLVAGEGACVLVVETLRDARRRNAVILGECCGWGEGFGRSDGLQRSMTEAMRSAHCRGEDLAYLSASAVSLPDQDAREARAIRQTFGADAGGLPVSALASQIGSCYSAAGSFQAVSALGALQADRIPATIHTDLPDETLGIDVVTQPRGGSGKEYVLVNAVDATAASASLVLRRYCG